MRKRPSVRWTRSVRWSVRGLRSKRRPGGNKNSNAKKQNDSVSENGLQLQRTHGNWLKNKL